MKAIVLTLALAACLLAGTSTAVAAKPKTAAHPSTDKTADEIGVVDGVTIARPNGQFLGLQIVNNSFVLSFYNEQKHKIAPDVTRATLRWPVKYQPADERAVLNPGSDGTSLTSAKTVRPPHNFKVALALFTEGSETAVETYSVDYHADADAP